MALIGPNGAGKSTLFNLISGLTATSGGQILLHGQPIHGKKPFEIYRAGLSRSFQTSNLFAQLSVFENLRCSLLWSRGYGYTFWRLLAGLQDVRAQAEQVMVQVQLHGMRDMLAAYLTYAEQRALELGITIAGGASVVQLDEPMAGMGVPEAARFVPLIRVVMQDKMLLIIEHGMQVMYALAAKMTVLVAGEVIAFDTPDAVRANLQVQAAYLGTVA